MKSLTVLLLAGSVLLSVPKQIAAQSMERNPSIKLGGGIGAPVGDVADGSDTIGLTLMAGVSVPLVGNTHALLEGHYTQIGPDDDVEQILGPGLDANLKLTGGNLGLMLRSEQSPISLYGLGGIGLVRVTGSASVFGLSVSETESTFSFVVGGGVHVAINPSISLVIDARYNHGLEAFDGTVQWIPITAAIVFSL